MLWAALLPPASPQPLRPIEPEAGTARDEAPGKAPGGLEGLTSWCLQFTPRVACIASAGGPAVVVMELSASLRLFGGRRRLARRVRDEAQALGVRQLSWAPTSLAAAALARAGQANGFSQPLGQLLDELPLHVLPPVQACAATLSRLGCRTLGQVRALPRAGLVRRFGPALLDALDQAYGLRPEAHDWIALPETFQAHLELMARVETAPALLFGARRLLRQLCGWLAARHAGVTAFSLHWHHDGMRSRSTGPGGALTVRTAAPTRQADHLGRLLAEHLAHATLRAPVDALELRALEIHALEETSFSWLPDDAPDRQALDGVLERIAARLGPERVLRPVVREDHRPEWMTEWRAAGEAMPSARTAPRGVDIPQPAFLLPEPLRLAVRRHRPLYRGELRLLIGPHRVEGGWWHRGETAAPAAALFPGTRRHGHASRDYWVALNEQAGVVWVFRTRIDSRSDEEGAWFLHGVFA